MRREEETRWENLLGEKSNLFVGLGYRLTRSLRLGGRLRPVLRRTTRTPSSTSAAVAVTPYVSLSFDVDLVGAFKGW